MLEYYLHYAKKKHPTKLEHKRLHTIRLHLYDIWKGQIIGIDIKSVSAWLWMAVVIDNKRE